jgi:thymidine phosphorylase
MLAQEIIRKKRDKQKLSKDEINEFISGIAPGQVSEGQVAAFAMAVLLNGMEMDERIDLTSAMANSGTVLEWDDLRLSGPILDKHSTGGIGDKVSLILAPVIAACGGFVPMLSGRGLGHTGGTLDKMDSIAGYVSQPDLDLFKKTVKEAGCAIIGATKDLAPADRVMYAVRDVTGTVESIDLITASILSKKLAAGLDGLVMDVKFGTGAFMQSYDDAKALAESIVEVANGAGMPTVALMTDMNQVLGSTAGNALEVLEAVNFLKGEDRNPRLYEVTTGLCSALLVLGGLAKDKDEAWVMVSKALSSGKAAEHFQKMVSCLFGPKNFVEKPQEYLKQPDVVVDILSEHDGYITSMDARAIGVAIVELGGGRRKPSDGIDHAVGLSDVAQIGDKITAGETVIAKVHAASKEDADRMAKQLNAVIKVSEQELDEEMLSAVKEKVGA